MSWKEDFNAALLRFTREDLHHYDAEEVTGFEQAGGQWSEPVIEITYRDRAGHSRIAEWQGDFAELIGRLAE